MVERELNLKEPEQAFMWLKAFEARARIERRGISTQHLKLVNRQLSLPKQRIIK